MDSGVWVGYIKHSRFCHYGLPTLGHNKVFMVICLDRMTQPSISVRFIETGTLKAQDVILSYYMCLVFLQSITFSSENSQ